MFIFQFPTLQQAQDTLKIIEDRSIDIFEQYGYYVNRNKRKVFTQDDSQAFIDSWDSVSQKPDGRYYFQSPRNKYPELFDIMTQGLIFEEIEYTIEYESTE